MEDDLVILAKNQEANMDPFGQYENDKVSKRLHEELQNFNDIDESIRDDLTYTNIGFGRNCSTLPVFQNSIISGNICSLNPKQSQIFEIMHKWSRDYVKDISS